MTDQILRPRPAWASADGRIAVSGPASTEVEPEGGAALVIETVYRFALAFGERERAVLADCFTADAVFSANIGGETDTGVYAGRDRIVDWLAGYWPRQTDQRRHLVTNAVVDFDGPHLAVVTALLGLAASEHGEMRLITAGFYRCALRRESDGAWRIAEFGAGYDAPY